MRQDTSKPIISILLGLLGETEFLLGVFLGLLGITDQKKLFLGFYEIWVYWVSKYQVLEIQFKFVTLTSNN